MWYPTTLNNAELNLSTAPIDYLADVVNKLSQEDFSLFKSRMSRKITDDLPLPGEDSPDNLETGIGELTRRENEVLVLVASGYSRKEIGSALRISENTAASHIASIYRKLDIRSIAEATNIAIRAGVI